jgi:hypothetical protein
MLKMICLDTMLNLCSLIRIEKYLCMCTESERV